MESPNDIGNTKLPVVSQQLGREIRVFPTTPTTPPRSENAPSEDSEEFYELTAEDYNRIWSTRKNEAKFLKTRKLREAEEARRRSRATEAAIRVRFPDNYTLEANFHPSEKFQSLIDLLTKVIARPELPFYVYTTPPKKRITDMSRDFYSAGFVPGAIVYFTYDLGQGHGCADAKTGPFLREEIKSLNGLDTVLDHGESLQITPEPVLESSRPAEKKPATAGPKWFKR